MIHKSTIYLILLLFYLPINSQNKNAVLLDSSFNHLTDKYYEYKNIDTIKARKYVDLYIEKAGKNNDTLELMDGHFLLSDIKDNKYIYLNYLDSLIKITTKKPNKKFPAILFLKKGYRCLIYGMNKESLINYISAVDYSTNYKNDSIKYVAKLQIGLLKAKNLNYSEAKNKYLEVYSHYKSNPELIDTDNYFSLLLNISKTYIKNKKYDSAYFYNEKVLQLSKINNDTVMTSYALFRDGNIKYELKEYKGAINSFKKSLSGVTLDENYSVLSSSYNYIAKSYSKLNQKTKSIKYYLLIDSLYQKTNVTDNSQKSSYQFLIKYYKEKKDLKNQLIYIEKLIKVDSILNTREKNLAITFKNEYDIPKLNAEKEKIINQLKGNLNNSKKSTYVFLGISILILSLLFFQIRKKKILKNRFKKFIRAQSEVKESIAEIKEKDTLNISKEIIENVLVGLTKFEKNHKFTDSSLSLKELAANLKTNSNYLSKIINFDKGKSYTVYIKDLRINYCLELLDKDELVRKYSIKALAKEVGFNTAESFSNAFYKKTGLNPSFYIKELNNRK